MVLAGFLRRLRPLPRLFEILQSGGSSTLHVNEGCWLLAPAAFVVSTGSTTIATWGNPSRHHIYFRGTLGPGVK